MSKDSPPGRAAGKIPKLLSREAVEQALGELALRRTRIIAEEQGMQEEITLARTRCEEDTKADRAEALRIEEQLEAWAGEHGEEFEEKRSVDFIHGTVGFRLGQRQLKTRSKWTWDRVLEGLLNTMTDYVRRTPEVDKVKLLRDASGEQPVLSPEQLAEMGVRVAQEEKFFVELKEL
jgi:hypothetical protein